MTWDPRPHQQRAIDAVASEFSASNRATVTMMCGTGKTLVGQRLVDRLINDGTVPANGRVLMLFPSLALIGQTYESWTEQARLPFRAIAFASENGIRSRSRGAVDEMGAETLDFDHTTEPEALARWLEEAPESLSVVFGTYQSSPRLPDVHDGHDAAPWDLIVFDEAHNTSGALDGPYATALHDEHVPARLRVFMTATPKVHTRRESTDVASMDDEQVYGRKVYSYPLPEAVADGVLTDYEVVVMMVSEPDVLDYVANHPDTSDAATTKGEQDARDRALAAIALLRAARQYDLHRLITFHKTVEAAEVFSAHLAAALPNLPADALPATVGLDSVRLLTVKGADSPEHRDAMKHALGTTGNEALTVLSNCKVFAEGVDVPTLDGLVLADARRSPVEVTQIVGRIIRKNKMRTEKSVLILPVTVRPGDDPQAALASGTFNKVWQTLVALAEHDVEMAADLERATRRNANGTPGTKALRKVTLVGDGQHSDLMRAFEAVAVERTVDQWRTTLVAVEEFVAREKRWPSRYNDDHQETRLGVWLKDQRGYRRKGTLTTARIEALDALGCHSGMTWRETRVERWRASVEGTRGFVAVHGRWPSQSGSTDDERRLGRWIAKARHGLKAGSIKPELAAALDEVSSDLYFPWNETAESWQAWFPRLSEFVEQHGRLPSPSAPDAKERGLGSWRDHLARVAAKGILTANQTKALDGLTRRAGVKGAA